MAHPLRRSLFDIAVATGSGWDVDDMAARMPLYLWHEWVAYSRLNPLAMSPRYRQRRADWNAAMLATAIVNTVRALAGLKGDWLRIRDLIFPDDGEMERPAEDSAGLYRKIRAMMVLGGAGAKE